MRLRYLIYSAAVALAAAAAPAVADGRHARARQVEAVRVSAHGADTLIAVEMTGPHEIRMVRFLWSHDRIDALAVRDVDNDGDLDILAASPLHGLLLWRNTGRGHFRAVPLATPHGLTRPAFTGMRTATGHTGGDAGLNGNPAELPRAALALGDLPVTGYHAREIDLPRAVPAPEYPGRAPPIPT